MEGVEFKITRIDEHSYDRRRENRLREQNDDEHAWTVLKREGVCVCMCVMQ